MWSLNLVFKNGIATSKDQIALETNTLNFIVNGEVNLQNETIDLVMTPSVSQTRGMANQLLGTVQSIRLKGPWTKIEPSVDAGKAVSNLAQIAIQKLSDGKQEPTSIPTTSLCQKALGHKLTQTKKTATNTTKTSQKKASSSSQEKPNLKQQLMQSLSQVLAGTK